MTHPHDKPHHPLPADERSRHDRLPENIEEERPLGADDPGAAPSPSEPPEGEYRNPDGSTYRT